MAETPADAYVIMKGSDGGYVVRPHRHDMGFAPMIAFAATSIDEALRYIRRKLEPARAD